MASCTCCVLGAAGGRPSRVRLSLYCWRRLRVWEEDGTRELIWRGFLLSHPGRAESKLEWAKAFLDGSFVALKKGSFRRQDQAREGHQGDAAYRRQRLARRLETSKRQPSRGMLTVSTFEIVRTPRVGRGGRPEQRPKELIADKTCDSRRFRSGCAQRGQKRRPTLPAVRTQAPQEAGRPVKAGLSYSERWKVERTFACLGSFRRFLVRHEATAPPFGPSSWSPSSSRR